MQTKRRSSVQVDMVLSVSNLISSPSLLPFHLYRSSHRTDLDEGIVIDASLDCFTFTAITEQEHGSLNYVM